ncbi:MAG TPA: acyl-CoA dehydrogenase family protein [Candidatus Lokiarchaeia archaeon]|nr:acyl-CoA dehydrogenase family protein [Candidatus Lokiarchaeia archaeon]
MEEPTKEKVIYKRMQAQTIPDEVLEAMSLKNRYAFINANMMSILKDPEKDFFGKVQRFCLKYEKKNSIMHDEDFYPWINEFGAEHYVTRSQSFPEIGIDHGDKDGLTMEFMRCLAVDMFDPQFNMAMGASVLCINPIKHHHQDREVCLQAIKELVTGEVPGCICITEPLRGSDANHPETVARRTDDGTYLTGVKCYNTNAPKSKYAVVYGTEDPSAKDSDMKMSQNLVILPDDTVTIERTFIPWVPRVWIGKETFNETFVPNERILCDVGKGKDGLFEGLVPERMGIAILDCCEAWGAFAFAAIYCNLRKQMGQEIIKHQGVGFVLVDYWAQINNFTLAILQFCRSYDEAIIKYGGELPGPLAMALVAGASQMKYQGASLAERACYDLANLMGGAGVNDNTMMQDLIGISRIQEVVGGARQIQQYVMSMALRKLWSSSNR